MTPPEKPRPSEMERLAASAEPGLLAEFLAFLAHNRKWWMIPILILLAVVGVLTVLGSTGLAPFLYTLY